ncbi:hypothetical protein AURDEDRAFT_62900 [Auricularia subglabra TFB-10046 SS5]|nr:hypothetical protein AURDEDRAFT_62900 [Auricularia subglabra TFB-10046 SS5]
MHHRHAHAHLKQTALSFPIIDNHTHNLLKSAHRSTFSVDGLTTEASGEALSDALHTIAHMRATRQLAKLYECAPDWESVKAARDALEYDEVVRRCFKGMALQALLLDEGLNGIDEYCERAGWHEQWTTGRVARTIVRIEVVAQDLITGLLERTNASQCTQAQITALFTQFEEQLGEHAARVDVVGFKSVACYRTGLDISPIPPADPGVYADAIQGFSNDLQSRGTLRIAHKQFNDNLVRITLRVAAEFGKPVQFHTGLGDNDIRLATANPAVMQPLIEAFPNTRIVLLHASYPFTQEAGYLVATYKNVYLDFGEIFPMVSGDGQRNAIRQMLELCPTNKVMFSTDGHWWPETYYLGVLQGRQAILEVLSEYVDRDELTEEEAVKIVERAFFHNANEVYRLNLTPHLELTAS